MAVSESHTVRKYQTTGFQFVEDINGVPLEMVLIEGGDFVMGSPEEESGRDPDREQQQPLTVQTFCLGKYPVTQEQWKAVAALEQVSRDLDPDPSEFKGGDRPVERVSWFDAVEFCRRLQTFTGRPYSLPGEDQWEYACRAGTTTPFHFGRTITPDLANYAWSVSYADGPTKQQTQGTTPVGSFDAANRFGLFDMHGNVWEWCADPFRKPFRPARPGGTPWYEVKGDSRVLRGGSWGNSPAPCRSAYRNGGDPDARVNFCGFRVACSPARGSSPLPS